MTTRDYSTMSDAALGEARAVALRQIDAHTAEARDLRAQATYETALPWPVGGDLAKAQRLREEAAAEDKLAQGWRADLAAIDTQLAMRGASARATAERAQGSTSADLRARDTAREDKAAAEEEQRSLLGDVGAWIASSLGVGADQPLAERAGALARNALIVALIGGGAYATWRAGRAIYAASKSNFKSGLASLSGLAGVQRSFSSGGR